MKNKSDSLSCLREALKPIGCLHPEKMCLVHTDDGQAVLIAEFHGSRVSNVREATTTAQAAIIQSAAPDVRFELVRAGWLATKSNDVEVAATEKKYRAMLEGRRAVEMIEDGAFARLPEETKDAFSYFGSHSKIRTPAEITYPRNITVGNWVSFGRYGKIVMLPREAFGSDPSLSVKQHYPELVETFDFGKYDIDRPADLFFGDGTTLGNNYFIICTRQVHFGKHVMTASNLFVSDCHHIYEHTEIPPALLPVSEGKPVSIGDHVWIGINCCILEGVTIGHHAVVAAGSIVKEDVPPYALVAGSPAKVKKVFKPGEARLPA